MPLDTIENTTEEQLWLPFMKTCRICGEVKDTSEFHKEKTTRDGLRSECKPCNQAKCKEWHYKNREARLETMRGYYRANRETLREYLREYHKANREARLEYYQARHQEHPEIKGLDGYCKRTGIKAKALCRQYGLSRKQLLIETRPFYKEAQRLTQETGEPHHVDHIVPIALGGEHRAYNLQVLHGAENMSKGANYNEGEELKAYNLSQSTGAFVLANGQLWSGDEDELTDADIDRLDQLALEASREALASAEMDQAA